MPPKVKQKRNAKLNAAHQRAFKARRKEQAKARKELMEMFTAAAPEGIEKEISYSLEIEDGEPRLVWDLEPKGATFINEFAATLGEGVTGGWVMKELSLHIGQELIRRAYDSGKGADHGQTPTTS